MGPFDLLSPAPPDRRGREPERNAWVELHNLIVAAEHPDELGPQHIDRIRRQRAVDLASTYHDERVRLYTRFLDWSLEDGDFSEANRALLGVLARTLHLGSRDLEGAHERAFGNAVHHALADDCLDVDERLLLYKLQHTLGLDPHLADGAFEVLAREKLLLTVARALCDGELSPDEAQEVDEAQQNLGVTADTRIRQMLDRAAETWAARNGSLAKVPTGLALRSTETGHIVVNAAWRRVDMDRLGAVYGDPANREMLDAGETFHLRVPPAVLRDVKQTGRAIVTNKRLVLDARGRKAIGIRLDVLGRILRFQNGVLVETRGDTATFIESDEDAALVRTLLRAMGHQRTDRPWIARWRPVYASERDDAFSRLRPMHSDPERYRAALPKLSGATLLSPRGEVRMEAQKLVLTTPDGPKRISIRSLRGAYARGRRVWVSRRGSHDWLFEFLSLDEAERFVRLLI
ncbi:MAG: hypothetical protein AAGI52_10720 [Bacteroidota bacterium]